MTCKRMEKEIRIGKIRIVLDFGGKDCYMGRFGGGWNWKIGFQVGGRTIIFNFLTFSLRIEEREK